MRPRESIRLAGPFFLAGRRGIRGRFLLARCRRFLCSLSFGGRTLLSKEISKHDVYALSGGVEESNKVYKELERRYRLVEEAKTRLPTETESLSVLAKHSI